MATIAKQTPWQIQRSVVFSLFVRELATRFGQYRLGYLWAILEPLAMIVVLSGVRILFGNENIAGLSFPVFFAAGILAYSLFNHILNTSLSAVESNLGVFNYQRVKPADVVAARAGLELLITVGTAALIFPGLYVIGFTFGWNDTLMVILIVALLFAFSLGFGLILSIVGPLWQEAKKIVPALIRPLFFVSGIFFPAAALPGGLREIALLNPLLHAIELLRAAMFRGYLSPEGDLFYLATWSLGSLFAGLCVYRLFRVKVLTSGSIR
jgi:capsular polysaccharide transport system permease protein